uniref:Uncharacterized protein n=1 Tax=Romanomermis culicivorax TaxID=13658 RepID=A0A915J8W3_ROMCU
MRVRVSMNRACTNLARRCEKKADCDEEPEEPLHFQRSSTKVAWDKNGRNNCDLIVRTKSTKMFESASRFE